MDHAFTPSKTNQSSCSLCKFNLNSHSDTAECESCDYMGRVEPYKGILLCPSCLTSEKSFDFSESTNGQFRVDTMNTLIKAREIDTAVSVRTDIFNSATVSIIELKKAIDADNSIENKNFALANALNDRFQHFKKVIFELSEDIIIKSNEQRAIQSYLNQLANSLRTEEREKLRLNDINYKPSTIKPIKTVNKSSKPKLDKVELRKYALELGISEFTLQMIVVSKGISVQDAANILRRGIAEAKSEISE